MPTTAAPPAIDEAVLLPRLRAGDEAAFEELLRTYGGRMLAVARRFLRNDADAHDVVQETFLAAFRTIDRFEGRAHLGTWLHRIVVHKALEKIRSRQRRHEESLDELLPPFRADGHHAQPSAPWSDGGVQTLERRETRALVRACIDRLPEMYRSVLLLRDIEGLDVEEAAQLIGLPVNTFKTRLHRARQALRTLLHPYLSRESV